VRLLGIDVTPDTATAGDAVTVTLFWEVLEEQETLPGSQNIAPPQRVVVRLWTLGGRLAGQRDATPAGEVYPPDLWQPGDVIRDAHRIQVSERGPATCRVEVEVHGWNGETAVGQVSSPPLLRITGPMIADQAITHPVSYTLDGRVQLIGYDLSRSGAAGEKNEAFALTLYWRPLANADVHTDEDYTVFVHLMHGVDTILAQGDGPPLQGDYPTSYWLPGEVVADVHLVPWAADLPPRAHFLVGLYRLSDGTRLPVYTEREERIPNDAIPLQIYEQ
jgi:hypothetical protein